MILEQTQPEPVNITKVYIPESTLPKNILNNDDNKSILFKKIIVKKFGLLFDEKKEHIYDYFPSQKVLTTQKIIIVDVFSDEGKVNKVRQEYFEVATEIVEFKEKKQVEGEYDDFNYEYQGIISLDCLSDDKKINYAFPSGDKVVFKRLGTMTNGILNVYVV